MKLLRNREVKTVLIAQLLISVAALVIVYMAAPSFVLPVLCLCLLFIIIFILSTHLRYKKIQEFSLDIDRVLHGDDAVSLEEYSEGELAVLQSEICKMTQRLRDQKQSLLDDRLYLSDSLADISHQIRTPLTSANILMSMLQNPGLEPEKRTEYIHELITLLSRIDRLVTALLKISRLDTGTAEFRSEAAELSILVNRAAEPLLIPLELKNQTLRINASGSFTGDLAWTEEAVSNIIKNCMEHTPEGGTISIEASENALYSQIVIEDSGPGIDPEDLPHIFERFYKGKNSSPSGFGIGLALARAIVCAQNGSLKAENARTGGAMFTIRFYKGVM